MKKKWMIAVVLVLVVGVLASFMPWNKQVSTRTVAYEYALDSKDVLKTHEVTMDGRYFFGIWREAYFDGTFAVEGFPFSAEDPVQIRFQRDLDGLGIMIFRDWAGQPYSGELNQIRCSRDFSDFAVMVFELEEKDGKVYRSWDPETGRILCTNAPEYAALVERCETLGFRFWEEDTP